MKKLMLVAVMVLSTMTAFAQEAEVATEEVAVEEVAEAAAPSQEDFAEVAVAELPEAVSEAVVKNYPTATINKAYVNEAAQYKLEVSLEDGTSGTLYADADGNWIEL